MACKPGSVPRLRKEMTIPLGRPLPERLTRPTRTATRKRARRRPYLVLLPVGLAVPASLPKPRCALTAPFQPCLAEAIGGVISVALSLESPPPDVIRHRVSVEPGLSSTCSRTPRPSGHLTRGEDRGL